MRAGTLRALGTAGAGLALAGTLLTAPLPSATVHVELVGPLLRPAAVTDSMRQAQQPDGLTVIVSAAPSAGSWRCAAGSGCTRTWRAQHWTRLLDAFSN